MLKLIIEDDEGRKTVVPFVRDELTIGRQEGNAIRLTERNVSRRHARLLRQQEQVLVEDLGSYNGIRLNGERIEGQVPVRCGDLIQIGDYELALQQEGAAHAAPDAGAEGAAGPAADPRQQATAIIRRDQMEPLPARPVAALDPASAPRLVVLAASGTELEGREFRLVRTELRIGRSEDNDIAIDHRSLSRAHARLVRGEDGAWRVLDLQSANGLAVNGERYAQAPLAEGDVLELGHVRLRFTHAGAAPERRPGSRARALAVGLGAAALLGAGAWAGLAHLRAPVAAAPPAPAPRPSPAAQALAAARAAFAERHFEQGLAQLEPLRAPDGALPPEAEALRAQAGRELEVRGHLLAAQAELEAGRIASAQALLAQCAGTEAYAGELAALGAQAEAAAAAAQPPAAPPAPGPGPRAAPRGPRMAAAARALAASPGASAGRAQALYEDGFQLFKQKQFREAELLFRKCLGADEAFASCHMMLGTTYASLQQLEKGAYHYRRFLELAPEHPKAAAVRRHLEEYEKARTQAQ